TITAFSIDDYDLSQYIDAWFGSRILPANGSLSVQMRSKELKVPSDHVFAFAGVDANGQKWSKQITVPFRGPKTTDQNGASMKLTSDPNPVVKVGRGDPNCDANHPFGQTLILQEQNGVAVKLTKFTAGGS